MADLFRAADAVRAVDLAEYAQRVQGYELRPRDGGGGIAVLENVALQDRIAVARTADGRSIYAGVREYGLRGPDEPPEEALARLQACIARSPSRGSVVEFAEHTGRLRREQGPPIDGAAAPSAGADRAALGRRMHSVEPAAAGPTAPPTPEQVAERRRHFEEANRAIDARSAPPRPPAHVQSFEAFDLVAYARRQQGYEVRPNDGGPGIAVLENAALHDRIAVARTQDGRWIYADVRAYTSRGQDEPAERALARLRACIERSPSKGDAAAFAARVEGIRRGVETGLSGNTLSVATGGREPGGMHVDAKRELSKRYYDLAPVGPPLPPRGRGPDRGR